jgi:hypothetical protein
MERSTGIEAMVESSSIDTDTEIRESTGLENTSCDESSIASLKKNTVMKPVRPTRSLNPASSSTQPTYSVSNIWKELSMRQNSASTSEVTNHAVTSTPSPVNDNPAQAPSSKRHRRKRRRSSTATTDTAAMAVQHTADGEAGDKVANDSFPWETIGRQLNLVKNSDVADIAMPIAVDNLKSILQLYDIITWKMDDHYRGGLIPRCWYRGVVVVMDDDQLTIRIHNSDCVDPFLTDAIVPLEDIASLSLVSMQLLEDIEPSASDSAAAVNDQDDIEFLLQEKRLLLQASSHN